MNHTESHEAHGGEADPAIAAIDKLIESGAPMHADTRLLLTMAREAQRTAKDLAENAKRDWWKGICSNLPPLNYPQPPSDHVA